METYRPIRIIKDHAVMIVDKIDHEENWPHSALTSVENKVMVNLRSYTGIYRDKQRINAPTAREHDSLIAAGVAALIPQHAELGCDDPSSPHAGARFKTGEHRVEAARDITDREKKKKDRDDVKKSQDSIKKKKEKAPKIADKEPESDSKSENNSEEKE